MLHSKVAQIYPFLPYRYSAAAGRAADLLTQPYDKISPAMRERYLSLSPHNLVRLHLPESYPAAARLFEEWIAAGVLVQDKAPALFAYFQDFSAPEDGERLTRKGFIGLTDLVDYAAGVVFRHEQTLSGPKKDRLELMRHTRAQFGQIFMVYPDPEGAVDRLLDQAASASPPLTELTDEYGARHRLWRIPDAAAIQELMAEKKLLIADGHHRYETALAFREECPSAARVMMTFVSRHSQGLKILPTHRVVFGLEDFDPGRLVFGPWAVSQAASAPDRIRIGVATASDQFVLERPRRNGELDVAVLHQELLGQALGIGEEAVRDQRNLRYVRGADAAIAEVRQHGAQAAFLLEPTPIEEVARVAFSGGVMPQKSTDFYPKLLSGMAIYRL